MRLVECCFTSAETVGLLGTGAQDGRLDFHTASSLSSGSEAGQLVDAGISVEDEDRSLGLERRRIYS